jgi:hypothetical protein
MSRFFLLVLLAAAPLMAQTHLSPNHHKPAAGADDDKWLKHVDAFEDRARQILKAELSRNLDPACNPDKLSNADFGNCFAADEAVTERNYRAFVEALRGALAIQAPDIDPKIFPPASKNFAAGEAAWRTFADKTWAALGDTYEGGTAAPSDMTACQQNLTRQHMKDLNQIFLTH